MHQTDVQHSLGYLLGKVVPVPVLGSEAGIVECKDKLVIIPLAVEPDGFSLRDVRKTSSVQTVFAAQTRIGQPKLMGIPDRHYQCILSGRFRLELHLHGLQCF